MDEINSFLEREADNYGIVLSSPGSLRNLFSQIHSLLNGEASEETKAVLNQFASTEYNNRRRSIQYPERLMRAMADLGRVLGVPTGQFPLREEKVKQIVAEYHVALDAQNVPTANTLTASPSLAPAESMPSDMVSDDFVNAAAKMVDKHFATNGTEMLLVNLDPSENLLVAPEQRAKMLGALKDKLTVVDFSESLTLEDINTELVLIAKPEIEAEANSILNTNESSAAKFEKLWNLVLISQGRKQIVYNGLLNLLNLPEADQTQVLRVMNHCCQVAGLNFTAADADRAKAMLERFRWTVTKADFKYAPSETELNLPMHPQTSTGYELTYEDRAKASLKAMALSNVPRFSQSLRALSQLMASPHYPSLSTKKLTANMAANWADSADVFSSVVTHGAGGQRIIWVYEKLDRHIRVLDVLEQTSL